MRGARLLVVGLDGATFDVIDPLVAAGRLPVLARLLREGARGPLRSTTPAMTLPAWSSILTGASPGRHGIFDFTARVPGTYRLAFTNSTWRRLPTFHRLLSDRGARVASVAVPTTYPPEPLDGVVVSGFDSPVATRIDGSFVYPRALYPELVRRFGGMAFADFQELSVGPGWHDAALQALLREIPRKERVSAWLMERERLDALMVVFGETDTVSHHFWMFHDPDSPRHPAGAPAHLRDAIATVYARADAALGRLIAAADPELVVVVSDHGFGAAGDRVLYLNRFLEQHGWLRYRRGAGGAGSHRTGSGLADRAKALALRTLPPRVQEQVVRRMPARALARLESSSRYGDLDFAGTRAWSDELNYAATVHLNVAGRDPRGTVVDREVAAAELSELLLSWRVDGERVVERVHLREALYDGPHVVRSPDLVLELTEPADTTWTLLPSARSRPGKTWRRLRPDEHVGGKGLGMNGTHRTHGVWIQWGRGAAPGARVDLGVADVLPTMFAPLGHAIPDHCDGRVRQDAYAQPVRPTWSFFDGALPDDTELSAADAREVGRRLESLGYL